MKITYEQFLEDSQAFLKQNAVGGAVVFLKSYHKKPFLLFFKKNKPYPELFYHFHFIFLYEREKQELTVHCLDTGFFSKITHFNENDFKKRRFEIFQKIDSTIAQFINLISVKLEDTEPVQGSSIFNKSSQDYWDIFNHLKENWFCLSLQKELSFAQERPLNQFSILDHIKIKRYIEDIFLTPEFQG